MKRVNLGYPQRLSLFHAMFDDEVCGMLETEAPDPLLALAIARMDFLRSHEKLLVSGAALSREGLLAMSAGDVQSLVMRAMKPDRWAPALYWEKALEDRDFFEPRGIRFVPIGDRDFPPQLREVYRPPFGLYLRGRLPDPEMPAVGIVGTRVPTGRGLRAAYALAADLSAKGVCVVSGLARGIDAAAHRGALKGGGRTLAVLPGGIETIYPISNKALASAILDSGGGLVTEYPPGTEIQRYRFPERNRIIAGMSRSCVVVEAPEHSGALITADHALTEGRDVFVHGACVGSSRNGGGDALASQGAVIVNNAEDLFLEWSASGRGMAARRQHERVGD
ncbi:MAG TPA: DNA-processing protein DprA [Rectinemataceae bacterium]|nr:DNA-processing protein DprA [Rectinemataceae bacterium]